MTETSWYTMAVQVTGDGLSYQWYEGAAGVTTRPVGTNAYHLTVQPVTTKSYWVRISGTCGTADSAVAMLSVEPRFTDNPDGAEVCAGRTATFTATATGDPATLTYEWRRQLSGSSTSEVIGGNATSVTVPVTATMQVWCTAKSGNSPWIASACATATPVAPPTIINTRSVRAAGGRYTLYVDVPPEEGATDTFEWFEGQLGDTRFLISYSYYVNVYPTTTPAHYWVRVTSPLGCSSTQALTVP